MSQGTIKEARRFSTAKSFLRLDHILWWIKGTVSRVFRNFLLSNKKNSFAKFFVHTKIFAKIVWPGIRWLHTINFVLLKYKIKIIFIFSKIECPRGCCQISRWLCGLGVGVLLEHAIFELCYQILYLCDNKKVRETVWACSSWAQVESFEQKRYCRDRKSRDTVPFKASHEQAKQCYDFSFLKGSVSRDFRPPVFFHDSNPSGPLINRLKYFRIRFRFRRNIRSQSSKKFES